MTPNAPLVDPAHHSAPRYTRTLGPEVGKLGALVGFPPDAEQQLLLDDTFAMDARNKSAAFEVCCVAPRQNLKTGWLKLCTLGWLFLTDERLIVWSAHIFPTAQEAFRDMEELISGSDMLRRRVKKIYRGNGDEAIELLTGQRLVFKARTKDGGRGLTGWKVILDEAFALKRTHLGALLPTLSVVPDPQVVYGSSAGKAEADVLRAIRDRGRLGDPRLAYAEWCAPRGGCASGDCDHSLASQGCALDDVANWYAANPTLGKRMSVDHIAAERQAMPPDEFGRERLGWWDEASGELVVPAKDWTDCLDLESQIVSEPVFALDVSPTQSWSAIGIVGIRDDDLPHVEVTSRRGLVDHREGADWVVQRCVELNDRWPGLKVWIAAGSAAQSLVPALTKAGIEVDFVKGPDIPAACGLFYRLATTQGVRHRGQPELIEALAAARRNVEDGEGAWRWGRRKSDGDITALYAVTLALWAALAAKDAEVSLYFFNDLDEQSDTDHDQEDS